MLDNIKSLGFKYSTKGGITVGYRDIIVPEQKKQMLADAEDRVIEIEDMYMMGVITAKERREHIIKIWEQATKT